MTDDEEERLFEIKQRFGALTQRDRDMYDFIRLKSKVLSGNSDQITPPELSRL